MANKIKSIDLLPEYLKTDKNAKFLSSTIDQLIQQPQLERIDGYVGSKLTPTYNSTSDVYLPEALELRKNYQLEPALVVRDKENIVKNVVGIDDLTNEIAVKGGLADNLDRLYRPEYYSFNPHIDWDKFINFQEYYWLTTGPDTIVVYGQNKNSTSTYFVTDSEVGNAFIFTPDGLTQNPLVKLYRGNTYNIQVNASKNLYIKTAPSLGNNDLYPGVVNNGTANGTISFTVDGNTPDILYYSTDDETVSIGQIFVTRIEEDTVIDVENDIVGKKNYTSGTGLSLSNGMKVRFGGTVTPEFYREKEFFVEGVGNSIRLIEYDILSANQIISSQFDEDFDATPFDSYPFDNFKKLPIDPEYITINRGSKDLNPWSRYNRWVHSDVIRASASANGVSPVFPIDKRARRPIIEFDADIRLYNFGSTGIQTVDFIDTYTQNAFRTVENSAGYYVDGVALSHGDRVIFNVDNDDEVRGKIYVVKYQIIDGGLKLNLEPAQDHIPVADASTVINKGKKYQGTSWRYDGAQWVYSQQHDKLNQPPLFELYDNDGNRYSDNSVYASNFLGNKIFGYDIGTGANDEILGFPLKYKNSVGVGSYLFKNYFSTDTITIAESNQSSKTISTEQTFFKVGEEYVNVWTEAAPYRLPIIQFTTLQSATTSVEINAIDRPDITDFTFEVFLTSASELGLSSNQLSGLDKVDPSKYTTSVVGDKFFVNFVTEIPKFTNVLFKIYTDATPNSNGYYETPLGLTNNPLNGNLSTFTLSDLSDHLGTMVQKVPGFAGNYPGPNNLRDLYDFEKYGSRLIINSNPIAFSNLFIGDQEHSVINAIEKVADHYNEFKFAFLNKVAQYSDQIDPVDAVDNILLELNKDKNLRSPYFLSDMLGYGSNKTVRSWTVASSLNKVYPISSEFNLNKLGLRSVLIYVNGSQRFYGIDYEFLENDSKVRFLMNLNVGDQVTIVDYPNTEGCYVPPTPTKLGLFPKFIPSIFVDVSYAGESQNVIRGHDGSIMLAYNDYRDLIIFELEKRIFNNLKVEYREDLFDRFDVLPGFFRKTDYSLSEIDQILERDFIRWAGVFGIDYSTNTTFDQSVEKTWNYTGAYNRTLESYVKGYWRTFYRDFYDTESPSINPWTMLGFTVKPSWWDTEYGPAPYTSGNLRLWEDLEEGRIRHGDRAGVDAKFARPGLMNIIPVNDKGEILPVNTYLSDYTPDTIRQKFVFGDHGPVETVWIRSSYFPFALQRLMALTKPASYCALMYDTSRMVKNLAGQWTYGDDKKFLNPKLAVVPSDANSLTSGYSVFVAEVGKIRSGTYIEDLKQDLQNIDFNLFHKVGGFISKNKLQVIIDAYDPTSTSPGAILPQENYDLILNTSNPISSVGLSGIVIQKNQGKFVVKGYDKFSPYFHILKPVRISTTPSITVGGVSEPFVTWTPSDSGGNTGLSDADVTTANSVAYGAFYQQGQIVAYSNKFYRVKASHRAGATFDPALFVQIPAVPLVGGVSVQVAAFYESTPTKIPYGTGFDTIQEVYDFIIGYGKFLESQGFIFDSFNNDFNTVIDWNFSAREFLYWTTQNWAENSIITLSPFAEQVKFFKSNSVVDNIFNKFYEYSVLKADGQPFPQQALVVNRRDGTCTITTANTTEGIYFVQLNSVQKEHGMVFDNTTIFNDSIFDIETGYRQLRMKLVGFRTRNWDGDYFSPGFVYDAASVSEWKKYKDYKYGELTRFNGQYYSAKQNISGAQRFNVDDGWVLLTEKPEQDLIPNFDYKINQFEDFYSLDIDNFDQEQQKLAQHLIGYSPRVYLNNVFTNPIAQYKFYQGYIKEKGTKNSIKKLAKATINNLQGEIDYFEEWAFRVGSYGSYQTFKEIEFPLSEGTFIENPQIVNTVATRPTNPNDLVSYILPSQVVISPTNFDGSVMFETSTGTLSNNNLVLNTAGYVRIDDVDATAYNENSLLDIATNQSINEGSTVWLGFKKNGDWDVLRYEKSKSNVIGVFVSSPLVSITFVTDTFHGLSVGDIISVVKFNEQVNGVYTVTDIPALDRFSVSSELASINNAELPSPGQLYRFVSARIDNYDNLPADKELVTLPYGTKFWIDSNNLSGDGDWAVYEKVNNFNDAPIYSTAFPSNQGLGQNLYKRKGNDILLVSSPLYLESGKYGKVNVYNLSSGSPIFKFNYFINNDPNSNIRYYESTYPSEFGAALSYDAEEFNESGYGLIFAGAPAVGQVRTNSAPGGVRISTGTETANVLAQQGLVKISSVYPRLEEEKAEYVLLSPNEANYEKFGSSILVEKTGVNTINTSLAAVYATTASQIVSGILPQNELYDLNGDGIVTLDDVQAYQQLSTGTSLSFAPNPLSNYNKLTQTHKRFLVGAPGTMTTGSGAVYDYTITVNKVDYSTNLTYNGSITSPASYPGARFGQAIAGTDNGNIFAVGAPGKTTTQGFVSIYSGTTLVQTIRGSDIGLSSGSFFGKSIAIDVSGNYLFVGAPEERGDDQSYGKVVVFEKVANSSTYVYSQTLDNPLPGTGMKFGTSIDINTLTNELVVGAIGYNYNIKTIFDSDRTYFDNESTEFVGTAENSGTAYIYSRQNKRFVLADELVPDDQPPGSYYGTSVNIDQNKVYIGAPFEGSVSTGTDRSVFYEFTKIDSKATSLKLLRAQDDLVNLDQFQRICLIDVFKEEIIEYLDVIDPVKGKIAGLAEQELKYKSAYDPAVYSLGIANTVNDTDTNWLEEHVGELWWDLSTVKYQWYEQGDLTHRKNNWGKLFPGATIDVYEWVGSSYLPSEWSTLADTPEGLTQGISGQPKYPDNSVVSVKQIYNSATNSFTNYYYFWVKNKITVPNARNRRISSYQVASLIADPISYGYLAAYPIAKDSLAVGNVGSLLVDDRIHLNISTDSIDNTIGRHTEWLLLKEGAADSSPNTLLEKKLIDSLLGRDSLGNPVPDPSLSDRMKYGIEIRPRQTMFKDRKQALRNLIEFSNSVLLDNQITGNYDFRNLDSQEQPPAFELNEYDQLVEDNERLSLIDTRSFIRASISCFVRNGKIYSVRIDNPGFGYLTSPTVTVTGDCEIPAVITTTIDEFGKLIAVNIVNAGKGYITAPLLEVRPYTVIVLADETYNGKWTEFIWDYELKEWVRFKTQKYNTPLYWNYVDWQSETYDQFRDYAATVDAVYQISSVEDLQVGDYIKINNGGDGNYIIVEKLDADQAGTFDKEFDLVYKQNGTIQISDTIWSSINSNLGFDGANAGYDQTLYDQTPDLELSYIIDALKTDLFVGELKVYWNLFFFKAVKYALSEQKLLDWAFKTSFINVVNYAGNLDQRPVYKLQDSSYYEDYLKEVKPYHTQIRSYTTNYTNVDPTRSFTTDFDLPTYYDQASDLYKVIEFGDPKLNEYPWKAWADNYTYQVGSISIGNPGANYTVPPIVEIVAQPGDLGTGATAVAYISSGKLSEIKVTNPGSNYKISPKVILKSAGNGDLVPGVAYAVLTNGKVRTNKIGMKFDRISPVNQIGDTSVVDRFICNGSQSEFELTWLASPNKVEIVATVDGEYVLGSDYTVEYYTKLVNGYNKKMSKLVFLNNIPEANQILTVTYKKSIDLFSAVERIEGFYNPTSGMPGKDLGQLFDGYDYSKTNLITLGFDYTTAWDIKYGSDNYIPFGTTAYADDITFYTKTTSTAISTNTGLLSSVALSTTTGIAVGYYVNVISTLTNIFSTSTVKVVEVNPTTRIVKFSTSTLSPITVGSVIEFWNYDSNASILDTSIDGGTWSNAVSIGALGILPEDVIIDGDEFISKASSRYLDEFVPGRTVDAIGINVYTKNLAGAPLVINNYFPIVAFETTRYSLPLVPSSTASIMVVYENRFMEYTPFDTFTEIVDTNLYTVDWANNELVIGPQSDGGIVGYSIVSMGGSNFGSEFGVVDNGSATTNGTSATVQSLAGLSTINTASVYVNGSNPIPRKPLGFNSTNTNNIGPYFELGPFSEDNKRASVRVYGLVNDGSTKTVTAWFMGTEYTYYNEIRQQEIDGNNYADLDLTGIDGQPTWYFNLMYPPGDIEPVASQAIIEINDGTGWKIAKPPLTTYYTIDDTSILSYQIDPKKVFGEAPDNFLNSDIRVYKNGSELISGVEYTAPPAGSSIVVQSGILRKGDVLAILGRPRIDIFQPSYDYDIVGSTLMFVTDPTNKKIRAITYTDHDEMLIWRERFRGQENRRFKLSRPVLSDNYIWVILNGVALINKINYEILDDRITVQISDEFRVDSNDVVEIISISSQELSDTVLGYRIFNDMFNRSHYKRLSKKNTTYLESALFFTDTEIQVADASVLTPPSPSRNIPGVVLIDGERIEFFKIEGNTLSQLRRATLGTSPSRYSEPHTKVIDQSPEQTIPYNDQIFRQVHFVTTASTVYTISTTSYSTPFPGDTNSIVYSDGITLQRNPVDTDLPLVRPEDQILVTYGGRLLRKASIIVHDISVAYDSPEYTEIIGSVANSNMLPANADFGVAYIVTSTNQIWVQTNSVEVGSFNGFVYKGLQYKPAEFSVSTGTDQVLTLNIEGGLQDGIRLEIIKKQFDASTVWNDIVNSSNTKSLLDSSTIPAKFLQARPAELPDKYYFGGDPTLTDNGLILKDENDDPLEGF